MTSTFRVGSNLRRFGRMESGVILSFVGLFHIVFRATSHLQMDQHLQSDPLAHQPGWDNSRELLSTMAIKGSLMRKKVS